jgi:hypothetical protein
MVRAIIGSTRYLAEEGVVSDLKRRFDMVDGTPVEWSVAKQELRDQAIPLYFDGVVLQILCALRSQ